MHTVSLKGVRCGGVGSTGQVQVFQRAHAICCGSNRSYISSLDTLFSRERPNLYFCIVTHSDQGYGIDRDSTMTFHCFLRLPIEIRIIIWELSTVEDRVLKACEEWWPHRLVWSRTPVPPVTRASQEARKYCKYQRFFVMEGSPRYIWTCYENDRFQMSSSLMAELSKGSSEGKKNIKHLRLQLVSPTGIDESDTFVFKYIHRIGEFPSLQSCEILVDNLKSWGDTINEFGWWVRPKSGVHSVEIRFVDKKTGEYITVENSGAYVDWIDTEGGTR